MLLKRTGSVWNKAQRARRHTVGKVCEELKRAYGAPRLGNPKQPLDDLVYIVISNKTSPAMARATYERLRERFKEWEAVLASPPRTLRLILRPAGLSTVKAQQLRSLFRSIKKDFGRCDLGGLKGRPEAEIHQYLTSLPGVSDKVAKCVMMYTMGATVLPVDAHVHRVATRLGWTARKRADQCHEELERLVPPDWRYTFHVGCVLHGREVCRPENPACDRCCIKRFCEYFRNADGEG